VEGRSRRRGAIDDHPPADVSTTGQWRLWGERRPRPKHGRAGRRRHHHDDHRRHRGRGVAHLDSECGAQNLGEALKTPLLDQAQDGRASHRGSRTWVEDDVGPARQPIGGLSSGGHGVQPGHVIRPLARSASRFRWPGRLTSAEICRCNTTYCEAPAGNSGMGASLETAFRLGTPRHSMWYDAPPPPDADGVGRRRPRWRQPTACLGQG